MSVINKPWAEFGDLGKEPDNEKIEAGHTRNDKATLQRFNWLQNRTDNAINSIGNCGFANIVSSGATTAGKIMKGVVYSPDTYLWHLVDEDKIWIIREGMTSNFGAPHGGDLASPDGVSAAIPGGVAISLDTVLGNGFIFKYPAVTTHTPSSIAYIASICSKHIKGGVDDFLILGGGTGQIEYSLDGDTNWTVPTTPISSSDTVVSIVHISGDIFKALAGTKVFTTTDNGDTWNTGVTVPGFDYCNKMCYNPDTGSIVVGGVATTTAYSQFSRSMDGGYTWVTSSFVTEVNTESVTKTTYDIKVCGQNRTVACGNYNTAHSGGSKVLLSIDDGITFDKVLLSDAESGDKVTSIATDGNRYITAHPTNTTSGTIRSSLRIV